MNTLARFLLLLLIGLLAKCPLRLTAQEAAPEAPAAGGKLTIAAANLPEDYSCMFCHGKTGTLAEDKENQHLVVEEKDLLGDVHWLKGLQCHDCHGGNASLEDFVAHRNDDSFRPLTAPAAVPGFCGKCHSDVEYMTRFQPSPSTNQEKDYLTSGHGKRLMENGDEKAATCVSCHGGHGMLAVSDLASPVYPTNVAKTCGKCHSDATLMAGRQFHGRPIGHDQFEKWSASVHAEAMLKRGDLSAATCNDCHGNHSTVAPDATATSNACSKCHARIGELFANTRMMHGFQKFELPGCAACHGNHDIKHPTDEMLGMTEGGVCINCHKDGKFGATLAGEQQAREMREALDKLKSEIAGAKARVAEAHKLGMEVRGPQFDLRKAHEALTSARAQVHSFSYPSVKEAIDEGLKITDGVSQQAQAALAEHTNRRIWLGVSLVPILVAILLLLAYIRMLPGEQQAQPTAGDHSLS